VRTLCGSPRRPTQENDSTDDASFYSQNLDVGLSVKQRFERAVKESVDYWHHRPETSADHSVLNNAEQSAAVRLADVEREDVDWLWFGRLALGKLTLIDGDPGLGKSLLTLDSTARVTMGAAWSDGLPCAESGSVLLLGAEDGLADTVRPRLDAAGADVHRVFALPTVGEGENAHPPSIPDDIPAIEAQLVATGAILLIIDPLMAFLGGRVNSHHDQDVRRAIGTAGSDGERRRVACLVVRHLKQEQRRACHLPRRRQYRRGGCGSHSPGRWRRSRGRVATDSRDAEMATSRHRHPALPIASWKRLAPCGSTGSGHPTSPLPNCWQCPLTLTSGARWTLPRTFSPSGSQTEPSEVKPLPPRSSRRGHSERTTRRAAKRLGVNTHDRAGFGAGFPSRWSYMAKKRLHGH